MSSEFKEIPSGRIMSIDALRGFDMFWIMNWAHVFREICKYINSPFSLAVLGQFDHSEWHGCTFYDLIYPLFLFIVGLSMPFAFSRRKEKSSGKKEMYSHIVKRTLILFILGLIYNDLLDFDFKTLQYSGILQRIAISYFFAALILINTRIKVQAVITFLLLLLYWALMIFIPVPGHGAGDLSPEGNLSGYLDRVISLHLHLKFNGFLSTIPSVGTTMIGVLTGHWLRASLPGNRKVLYLLSAGILCLGIGLLWNIEFPINKKLWSSSYVIYSAGWSLLLLGIFYWIIDIKGHKKWAFPFIVIGLNPITIYLGQRLFDFGVVVNIFVHGFIGYLGPLKPIFWHLCILIVQWLFLYFLYKKRIFLKA